MKLWDWAVAVHGAPGVDQMLLELQDEHGQCVSFLLWSAWTARIGASVEAETMAHAAALARGWESEVSAPLRAVRRTLKRSWSGIADADREALRARVKQDELESERRLLEALESVTEAGTGGPLGASPRLHEASAAWSSPAPALALDRLAQMVDTVDC